MRMCVHVCARVCLYVCVVYAHLCVQVHIANALACEGRGENWESSSVASHLAFQESLTGSDSSHLQ